MVKLLSKLGFTVIRQKGSHIFLRHEDGRSTVVPANEKDLKRGLIKGILKDVKLTKGEYENTKKKS